MLAPGSSVDRTRRTVASLASIIVVAIGVLALLGWLLDSAILKSIIPGLTAMNPMTAVGFVFSGIALWLAQASNPNRLSQLPALLVTIIALLKLAEIVFGWDIGIDRLLFLDQLQAESVPNRMAPNTAMNFLLVGVALYLTRHRLMRLSLVAQILTLTATFVASLAVIGYAYDARTFYGILAYIPMALNTAFAFLILCAGILSAQPDVGVMSVWRSHTPGGVLARRLTPTAIFVLLIMGWFQLVGQRVGAFDTKLGEALSAGVNVLLLLAVIWWTVRVIDRMDTERRRSEARYRALFEQSSDAIVVIDQNGRYIEANRQAENLTGYTRDELLRLSYDDLTADAPPEGDQVISGGNLNGESVITRKDDSTVTVEYAAVPIAGGVYQATFHDISERKKTEENLRRSLEHEQYLSGLKTRLVSMISHEFRTPLAVIRSSSDLLIHYSERTTPERRVKHLGNIQHQVNLLVQMLDDILIIRKAEMVGVEFNPQLIDLHTFCASLIAEVQPTTLTHHIEFSTSGDCANVSADPKLLRQALTRI